MMIHSGTGGTGKWAEEQLMEDITGSHDDINTEIGDVQFGDIIIEVKSTGHREPVFKDPSKKLCDHKIHLNQIRPMKYNVLVVYTGHISRYGCDYIVYSPDDVVRTALSLKGHHIKDSLQCVARDATYPDAVRYGCSAEEVKDRVVDAWIKGEKNLCAKKMASEALRKSKEDVQKENLRKLEVLDDYMEQNGLI